MHHTRIILVLSLIVTLVCSQTSSNPDGTAFFSPSLVRQLPVDNTPISSVLLTSPADYSESYWGYISPDIGGLSITLNVTNSCDNTVKLMINFAGPYDDPSFGFPCTSEPCSYDIDDLFTAYSNGGPATAYYNPPQFRPGRNFYITVYQYSGGSLNCSYTVQANSFFNCTSGTVPSVYGDALYCLSYSNVTSNGQSFSGVANVAQNSTNIYRIDVPKNVSIVYAWAITPATDLYLLTSAGFAPLYYYNADNSNSEYGNTLASNSSLYTYYLQYPVPDGDFPLYFAVKSTTYDGSPYTISFHWEYCGATKSGYGQPNQNFSDATSYYDYPACNSMVQFNDMNILGSGQNYTFSVPAYNSSAGAYGASFGFLEIPVGTYGAVNLTCICNTTNNYITYSRNQNTDCTAAYMGSFYCNGDVFSLISQELYVGGYWSFAACNGDNQPTSITLVASGSVTVPASPSPIPSASTSPGSTTGQDSSNGILAPAVILILTALAAIIQ